MSLTATTLNGAITKGQTLITLTAFTNPSSGGISAGTWLRVDGEFMLVTNASLSPTVQVARGINGTQAAAHKTLAPAIYGLTSDFTVGTAESNQPVYSYSADGAITIPTVDCIIVLNKATAAAMTIVSPPADLNVTVTIIAGTAQAHTVTYTPGFYGDTTSSDVATFTAKVGASFTIQAQQGLWGSVALSDVSFG